MFNHPWTVVDLMSISAQIHVVPVNDHYTHDTASWCPCKPIVTDETESGRVYLHIAYDKREHREPDHDWKQCRECVDNHVEKLRKELYG